MSNDIRLSDIWRMGNTVTLEILEIKRNELFALRPILESIANDKVALYLRTEANSRLKTQIILESELEDLIKDWKIESILTEGRVDVSYIVRGISIISDIENHTKNVDELKLKVGTLQTQAPKVDSNLIRVMGKWGPEHGVPQPIWYGILGLGGYLLIKKLLK